jgi:hypothetical protein
MIAGWPLIAAHLNFAQLWLLAQEMAQEAAQKPVILQLDGGRRAKVLAALTALVMLGFLLVVLTWLGGRLTRKYMNAGVKLKPTAPPGDEEWARPPRE